MSLTFMWIVTALYAAQALVFAWQGSPAQATTIGAYALANVGLIWSWH